MELAPVTAELGQQVGQRGGAAAGRPGRVRLRTPTGGVGAELLGPEGDRLDVPAGGLFAKT